MLILHPDPERRIDLPGAGPCLRPVDVDRSRTGFSDLVSLRVYSFASGVVIDGAAEEDEVFVVAMRGAADIVISHQGRAAGFPLRHEGGGRAAYLPPHASYRLSAIDDCDIAYARATPAAAMLPEAKAFTPAAGRLDVSDHATGMSLRMERARSGDRIDLATEATTRERFVLLHLEEGADVTIAGERLGDRDCVALGVGEKAVVAIETGSADIMAITAARRRKEGSEV